MLVIILIQKKLKVNIVKYCKQPFPQLKYDL